MSKLILITEYYPYGNDETSFLELEIEKLADMFDEITLISNVSEKYIEKNVVSAKLPANIKHINICPKSMSAHIKIRYTFKALFDVIFLKEIQFIFKSGWSMAKLINALSCFVCSQNYYRKMLDASVFDQETETLVYTYWYSYYTLAFLFNKMYLPNIKIVTRAHRIDLYNERQTSGRLPFRESMRDVLDGIFFISQHGQQYYARCYSEGNILPEYHLCRLGVSKAAKMNPLNESGTFELVSCSTVIAVKRVGLIIEGLSLIHEAKIHWTHFGDGDLLEKMRAYAEEKLGGKSNITFTFKGNVANEDILSYYETVPVDCFITTSESEGLPVSIMEVLAHGIPVIATDVGGIYEEVEDNGILMSANPTPLIVASSIEKILRLDKESLKIMRSNSFRMWKEKFDIDKNAEGFLEQLKRLLWQG